MRVLAEFNVYNEADKFRKVLEKIPQKRDYDVVIVNDGSTDHFDEVVKDFDFPVIHHPRNLGIGEAIRSALKYARENGYDIVALLAGNGKMLPEDVPVVVAPILQGECDYVQGSRFLPGGRGDNLPGKRRWMLKAYTKFVNMMTGFNGTDASCGFRAWKLSLLDHPKIDIWQDWLAKYELESYIHYKALTLGFRVKEVPVSMIYPPERKNYSKIKPFVGWWSILRPWLLLKLRLKR